MNMEGGALCPCAGPEHDPACLYHPSLNMRPVDSGNLFAVRRKFDRICFDTWPFRVGNVTRNEALNLAAWLSAIADPSGHDVSRLLNEIKRVPTSATTQTKNP